MKHVIVVLLLQWPVSLAFAFFEWDIEIVSRIIDILLVVLRLSDNLSTFSVKKKAIYNKWFCFFH